MHGLVGALPAALVVVFLLRLAWMAWVVRSLQQSGRWWRMRARLWKVDIEWAREEGKP